MSRGSALPQRLFPPHYLIFGEKFIEMVSRTCLSVSFIRRFPALLLFGSMFRTTVMVLRPLSKFMSADMESR